MDAIIERLSGEFDADGKQDNGGIPIGLIFVSVIVLIVILRLIFGDHRHMDNDGKSRGGGGRFIFSRPPEAGTTVPEDLEAILVEAEAVVSEAEVPVEAGKSMKKKDSVE